LGREGKRKRFWGQHETKVTRAVFKGWRYQNIDLFRNLLDEGSRARKSLQADEIRTRIALVGSWRIDGRSSFKEQIENQHI
jgi:hypothetical protein